MKNASSRVTKAFTDVIVIDYIERFCNSSGSLRYYSSIDNRDVMVTSLLPASSYYRFSGSTPLQMARGSLRSATQLVLPGSQSENTGGIDERRGARGKYSMNTL